MILSIIIPVYNCGAFLRDCLQSIREMGISDYEVILVDDGSTDGSAQVCDELTQKYVYARCIHQRNQGVSAARNEGLRMAKGEYVLFVDADDALEPQGLARLVEQLRKAPEADMAIFGLSFDYYHGGSIYRRDELLPPLAGIVERQEWVRHLPELFAANALSPIWNKLIRREVLMQNDLRLRSDMFLYEDLEYSLRCLGSCGTVLFEQAALYRYRQSEDEGNAGKRLRRIAHIPEVISRIENALEICMGDDFPEQKAEVRERILMSLYLVLAREKIAVSSAEEVGVVCDDFSAWYHADGYKLSSEFVQNLLNHRVRKLILRRYYSAFRHKLAVKLKSMLHRCKEKS